MAAPRNSSIVRVGPFQGDADNAIVRGPPQFGTVQSGQLGGTTFFDGRQWLCHGQVGFLNLPGSLVDRGQTEEQYGSQLNRGFHDTAPVVSFWQ